MNPMRYLSVAPEVERAIAGGRAVVALPSAPPPSGGAEALAAAAGAVREAGGVPAVIAVLGGKLRIGAGPAELRALAEAGAAPVGRGGLPILLAAGSDAPTAVSSALLAAAMTGIPALAAPLLGESVGPGAAAGEVPADLRALAHTPVALVCTGLSPLFDPDRCLGYLISAGVPLVGLGTSAFPTSPDGAARPVDLCAFAPAEAARVMASKWNLGLPGGLLAVVPPGPPASTSDALGQCAGAAARLAAAYAALR